MHKKRKKQQIPSDSNGERQNGVWGVCETETAAEGWTVMRIHFFRGNGLLSKPYVMAQPPQLCVTKLVSHSSRYRLACTVSFWP